MAALAAGCGNDAAGPADPPPAASGSYVLQAPLTIYDEIVPDSAGDYRLLVVATGGSLVLSDSSYQQEVQYEAFVDGTLAARPRWVDRGLWRVQGDTVHFDSGYLEGVTFHAVRQQWGLRVHQTLMEETAVSVYPFRRAVP